MILTDYIHVEVLRSPAHRARKILRSRLVRMSGGRLFQSLAVPGKNEYICGLIREKGMMNVVSRKVVCHGGEEF